MTDIDAVHKFRAHLATEDPATMTRARGALLRAMRSTPQRDLRRIRRPWLAVTAGIAGVGTALAVVVSLGSSTSPGPPSISANGSSQFPYQTASDIVSYADQVSVITALTEKDVADANVDPAQEKADGHLVARYITFRVDETVWHRAGAPELTGTFTTFIDAWWVKGSERQPFVFDRQPFIQLGDRYLTPLGLDGGEWSALPPLSVYPVKGSTVLPLDGQLSHLPLAAQLNGDTLQQAGEVFAAARPDPVAAKHFDLRPLARARAVGIAYRKHGR